MIIYYAALQAVPTDLEEAAVLDGANAFELRHAHQAAADLADDRHHHRLLDHRHAAALHRALPDDQPGAQRHLTARSRPNLYAYTLAFTGQQYNYSAAISFLLGGVTAVLAYTFMLISSRRRRW